MDVPLDLHSYRMVSLLLALALSLTFWYVSMLNDSAASMYADTHSVVNCMRCSGTVYIRAAAAHNSSVTLACCCYVAHCSVMHNSSSSARSIRPRWYVLTSTVNCEL
jgi:hypothetical protein